MVRRGANSAKNACDFVVTRRKKKCPEAEGPRGAKDSHCFRGDRSQPMFPGEVDLRVNKSP